MLGSIQWGENVFVLTPQATEDRKENEWDKKAKEAEESTAETKESTALKVMTKEDFKKYKDMD